MRYVIYTRVSTNKQTVENQLKECREHVYKVMQKGDEILEFSEPDSSTRKPMKNRKKLMEMMAELRRGDKLIVYKVDRLARDPQELINIYCDLRRAGVDIVGLNDPSLNEQSICIYAFIACTERDNIKVRTISGLNRKRANMERVGTTWYGYSLDMMKISTRENTKSEGKPYLLLPNSKEQEQIQIMMDCYSQGMSFSEIANELKARGHTNRLGNPIHKMTIYRILKRLGKLNQAPLTQAVG